jgi:hypothetical protein
MIRSTNKLPALVTKLFATLFTLCLFNAPAFLPTASADLVIATGDEWLLSDTAFSQNAASTNALTANLANLIGGSNYLILEDANAVDPYGSSFQSTLEGLGKTLTVNPSSSFSESLIQPYDAIFLAGTIGSGSANSTILHNYVLSGGTVFVALGTGNFSSDDATLEAAAWNPFLNRWGLSAGDEFFSPVVETIPTLPGSHPLRTSVDGVTWGFGQEITTTGTPNPHISIALTGAFGGSIGDRGIMGTSTVAVPEPGSLVLTTIGLGVLLVRRGFRKEVS